MSKACQYVFRYNGDEKSDEVVPDLEGEMSLPVKDQQLIRKGKPWKVVMVTSTVSVDARGPIPVHRVFLTDKP